MLPESLQSSYQQSKDDTNNIAKWLAKTARKCGYPADLLTNPDPVQNKTGTKALSKPKGRGKKKVTKQAGAAANMTAWELFQASQHSQPTSASQKKEYIIKVSSFISLAEFIALYENPPVKISPAFMTMIDRTIALRKKHATWFQGT